MNIHIGDNMRDKNTQIGGSHNTAVAYGAVSKAEEMTNLAKALGVLLDRIRPEDHASRQDAIAFGALAEAELTAKAGESEETEKLLRKAGRWALAQATAIGVPVAVEALKRAVGQ